MRACRLMHNNPDSILWAETCNRMDIPAWLALVIVLVCGLGFILLVALGVKDGPFPEVDAEHPDPSNRWSGICYRCGCELDLKKAVTLRCGGKPPKYFCPTCRPKF